MKITKIKQQIKEIYNSQHKCSCGCNTCTIKSDSGLSNNSINEYDQSLLNNKNAPINKEYFNPLDIITLDVPLFIRLLEYAKEDAKDDMDLHRLATKAIELSMTGGLLTMEDYDFLIPKNKIGVDEIKVNKPFNPYDFLKGNYQNLTEPKPGQLLKDWLQENNSYIRFADRGVKGVSVKISSNSNSNFPSLDKNKYYEYLKNKYPDTSTYLIKSILKNHPEEIKFFKKIIEIRNEIIHKKLEKCGFPERIKVTDLPDAVRFLINDYASKFVMVPNSEVQETETKPVVKPEVKPETKPRRRTLSPPEHAPETKPKAKLSEDEMIDKITKRFKNLAND